MYQKKNNINMEKRTFKQVAEDIKANWLNVYFGAAPYLQVLLTLDTTDPKTPYHYDTAGDIARYFLANAQTFCGAKARELKQELKNLIK